MDNDNGNAYNNKMRFEKFLRKREFFMTMRVAGKSSHENEAQI